MAQKGISPGLYPSCSVMRCDVAVIGAGPAGSMAAKHAARTGAETVLIEEHPSIGHPVQCAGLLGVQAVEASEIPLGSAALHPVCGAAVWSPGGRILRFNASRVRAWVVDRRLFDRALAVEAVRAGAILQVRSPVRRIRSQGDRMVLDITGGRSISARVVVTAEGVMARIARQAGIGPSHVVLSGAQADVPFQVEDAGRVEVHLGVSPGLFAWVIPTGPASARVGLCAEASACQHLRRFLSSPPISSRLLGSPLGLVFGGLPMGPPDRTWAHGAIAVGDAAGQVKPTSGGGIYPGLVSARIAGRVAAEAALAGDNSASRLSEYDRLWREEVGRELVVGMRLYRLMQGLSARETDQLLELLSRPKVVRAIEEHGDIDRPSRLVARMLPALGWSSLELVGLLRLALR
ncbi:MAG: Digeranylgeranylglycerophospholipid reductase [Methanosaeta sp. PtaB.Bin039]|nr:MAG: Digeranylgeranylglycerophospholipid reductase [Methanosaeta sp. PtaB.Bin039]HOT06039.1 NAD(P)/FAD-dependent oxidoreductase [Methanotrichaceae archaeon]HQJ27894.1 NAD(P)/FAD-dependent oxidoreductase [Methanotrichaceae archaeon]